MCDQQSLRSACAYAQSDQNLCLSLEYSMSFKLLTEHNLKFLSLKECCTGTLVKMPHCWKSHVMAHVAFFLFCRTPRPLTSRTDVSKPGSYASTASEKSKYLQVLKSKLTQIVDSFPANCDLYHLLITFANSFELDQAGHNVRSDLHLNILILHRFG